MVCQDSTLSSAYQSTGRGINLTRHFQQLTFLFCDFGLGFLYSGAAGRIGLDAGSAAFTTDSFTWIASMSKIVTSACVMQLVEQGLIDLDEDVRPRFPPMQTVQILRGFKEDGEPILEENTLPITLR